MTLKTFFGHDLDFSKAATMFSIHHLIYVLSAVLTVFLIVKFGHYIKESKHEKTIKKVVIGALIFLEIIYHIHNWTYPRLSIPLHICSFAVMMSIYMLMTDSKKTFEYLFFFGTVGGFMALVFPNSWGYTYLNFRYYHFFILHNILIAIPLYYYTVYGYRITYKTLIKVFKTVLIMGIFIHLINLTFLHYGIDSNYWFITYVPTVVDDFFTSYPIYIATFITLVFTTMNILFVLTHPKEFPLVQKFHKKNHSAE